MWCITDARTLGTLILTLHLRALLMMGGFGGGVHPLASPHSLDPQGFKLQATCFVSNKKHINSTGGGPVQGV